MNQLHVKPLQLLPAPDPDRAFDRELARMREPHAGEPRHVTERRRALAAAIERAHDAYCKRGGQKP